MDEEERARIEAEAIQKANLENRVNTLEAKVKGLFMGLGGAAAIIGTSLWDSLKEVLFK